ncbi:hypothetical protein Aros01_07004 [Streptosporangium roseum]|uniref:Uncharacterized protein n=1 Tax=Streptosporangium roseum (strain ATCC 12428 / DSM 43021 / JCM 3005 / KCTC 9067 / NCIMB 10171 / NRRL 2505 / NI 9100) TaxID=479432 RepID=D2B145_STRRD|nr:hypothetical protein Sros_0423 [Streptosporangium roseum DSM 43021]
MVSDDPTEHRQNPAVSADRLRGHGGSDRMAVAIATVAAITPCSAVGGPLGIHGAADVPDGVLRGH